MSWLPWSGPLAQLETVSTDGRALAVPADGIPERRDAPPLYPVPPGPLTAPRLGWVQRCEIRDGWLHGFGVIEPDRVPTEPGDRWRVGVDIDSPHPHRGLHWENRYRLPDGTLGSWSDDLLPGYESGEVTEELWAVRWRLSGLAVYTSPDAVGAFPDAHIIVGQPTE